MNKLLVVTLVVVMVSGLVGIPPMMGGLSDSYATKQSKQAPSEKTTIRPERQTEQPSEASEDTTVRPERQSEFSPEQQEDNDIELKDEQIRDVQQEEDDDENTGGNEEEEDEQVEIDKKAPIAISGDNVYIVWFNDQNTPNNNSEVLFRSSTDGGVTFADKINLSNTTAADSINAEIAADGNNVAITWWERNVTGEELVFRASSDSGTTFGPILRLTSNGTISG
jgi:hypothetical protein